MKIKVKIKYIILLISLGLFVYIGLIPFGVLKIAKYLDSKGSERSKIFYEAFISRAVVWNKSKALYEYGSGIIGYNEKYRIMMAGWGGGNNRTLEEMNKGIDAFRRILEKEKKTKNDMKYILLAYEGIMEAYINLQSPRDLMYWIDWGSRDYNKEINYISDLYLSFYHLSNREYDLAEKALDKYEETREYVDYKYYYIRGELALRKGDIDLAAEFYKEGGKDKDYNMGRIGSIFGSMSYENRVIWIKEEYEKMKGELKIRGKVSFNGEPMPFVEVYLEKGRGFRVRENNLVAITDINGEFETLGLNSDSYDIGIGLNPVLLYDKVYQRTNKTYIDLNEDMEFNFSFVNPFNVIEPKSKQLLVDNSFAVKWDEVLGASYYQVQIIAPLNPFNNSSGHISYSIEDENRKLRLRENQAIFDLEILRERSGGVMWSDDNRTVSPEGILSAFIPGHTFLIEVSAYDDNDKLISSSSTLRSYADDLPSIELGGELTRGEKLIYDMKYEEAISYYTGLLDKEENNIEALLYLSRMYMAGCENGKYDFEKAMEYAVRYGEIKGGHSLKYEIMGLMSNNSMRKHKNLIKEVLENISEDNRDDNYYYNQGKYYLSLGEYKLARESFENYKSYTPIYILYLDIYYGKLSMALDTITSGKLDIYNIEKIEMEKAIKGIKDVETEDFKIIQDIIEKVLSEDIDEKEGTRISTDAKLKIKDSYISLLLDQIIRENYWNVN